MNTEYILEEECVVDHVGPMACSHRSPSTHVTRVTGIVVYVDFASLHERTCVGDQNPSSPTSDYEACVTLCCVVYVLTWLMVLHDLTLCCVVYVLTWLMVLHDLTCVTLCCVRAHLAHGAA